MRLDPEFAKVVNSLVMAAREASTKDRSDDRTVVENLRYLRTGKMRSISADKYGHDQEPAVVGIEAGGATRILSSLQVIIDGMKTQGERTGQLAKVDESTGEGALVILVGKGLADLYFARMGTRLGYHR
jgi:hypothetical protein